MSETEYITLSNDSTPKLPFIGNVYLISFLRPISLRNLKIVLKEICI